MMKIHRGKTAEYEFVAADETSAVGVPLLIPVVAPRITSMSHSALIEWKKARTEYEESVKARSKGDEELYERLKESVKSTIDEKLLRALCTYRWGGLSKDDVTDDRIMSEVRAILQRVKNDTLPDVDRLFSKQLRLDMSESDVSERVRQRAWYDPEEFPELHLVHGRYYMRHRDTFFDCALYAPTDNSDARRRDKLNANQGRLVLVSANVCLFGWYGFLDRFENTVHDNLMWLGGKAAKRSVSAKGKASSATDLVTLWCHDRSRYDSLMARILDPCRVDEDGYQSIRELLEQTEALDPTRPPHLRLSDEALARIALDAGRKPPNPAWIGNKSSGIWKTLLTNSRIRALQVKIAKQLQEGTYRVVMDLKPFQRKEQGDNDSDYADDDATFTVQPPSPPVDEELEDVEEDESEEKPPAQSPTQEDERDDQEQDDADQDDQAEADEGGRSSDTHDAPDDKKSSSGDDKGDSSTKGNSKKKSSDSSSAK